MAFRHVDEEGIEELLWNRQAEVGLKAHKFEEMVETLDTFCQETRNAHKKVKDWAHDIKMSMKELVEETNQLREECIINDKEMKRLRPCSWVMLELNVCLRKRKIKSFCNFNCKTFK